MSRKLDLSSLARLSQSMRVLPTVLAQRIATKAAPVISAFAEESFAQSVDPYGAPWAPKSDGERATLRKSGALFRFVRYVAIGTRLRVALGVPYAKYQIGKRPIFPRQDVLPKKYADALANIAQTEARAFLGGS